MESTRVIEMPLKILRIHGVTAKLNVSRSWIYERINPKSPRYDDGFPKPIKLGAAAVGWLESDIDAWLQSKKSN